MLSSFWSAKGKDALLVSVGDSTKFVYELIREYVHVIMSALNLVYLSHICML